MKTQTGSKSMFGRKAAGASLFALALAVTACGGFKTNPTADYQDLKDFGAPHPQQAKKSDLDCSWVFPAPQYKFPLFIEGQEGRAEIDAAVTMSGIDYRIDAKNLPAGATFTQADEAGKYLLTYTPPRGTVSRNAAAPVLQGAFQISLVVLKAGGDAASCAGPVNGKTYDVQYVVSRSGDVPTITSAKSASDSVVLGQSVSVVVEGADTSAPKGTAFMLIVDNEDGGMDVLKGKDAVTFGAGKDEGNGSVRFEGKFDSSKITLPDGKTSATVRFTVRIVRQDQPSASSPSFSVDIKVMRPAAPAPKPSPTATPVVKASPTPAAKPSPSPAPQTSNNGGRK